MKPLAAYALRAERVAFTLGVALAVLVVVHVLAMQANFNPALGLKERFGFHYWQLSFFDLDEEESFGTWFSSGILLMAAVLLLHQAKTLRAQRGAWQAWWFVLGVGFCAMSVDEIAGMHEFMNSMMEDTLGRWSASRSSFSSAWPICPFSGTTVCGLGSCSSWRAPSTGVAQSVSSTSPTAT